MIISTALQAFDKIQQLFTILSKLGLERNYSTWKRASLKNISNITCDNEIVLVVEAQKEQKQDFPGVQWLGVPLPMQVTRVWSSHGKILGRSHSMEQLSLGALEPMIHNRSHHYKKPVHPNRE